MFTKNKDLSYIILKYVSIKDLFNCIVSCKWFYKGYIRHNLNSHIKEEWNETIRKLSINSSYLYRIRDQHNKFILTALNKSTSSMCFIKDKNLLNEVSEFINSINDVRYIVGDDSALIRKSFILRKLNFRQSLKVLFDNFINYNFIIPILIHYPKISNEDLITCIKIHPECIVYISIWRNITYKMCYTALVNDKTDFSFSFLLKNFNYNNTDESDIYDDDITITELNYLHRITLYNIFFNIHPYSYSYPYSESNIFITSICELPPSKDYDYLMKLKRDAILNHNKLRINEFL